MALKIDLTASENNFTQNGIELGTQKVYIDLMFIAPHGVENLQIRLVPYDYTGDVKGVKINSVDGVGNCMFPASEIIINDFWNDINAGKVHDKTIEILEAANPAFTGKITKIPPVE